ncbi:MAG: hypothetical protein KBT03_12040 [Bacteroidales bacterium]|nr:hypothetical protein [Candidatus Scybalousia scybalohippi]
MGYREVRRESKKAVLIDQYMMFKYGSPGQKRNKRRKPTPEEVKKNNQYNKKRKILWKLQTYFEEDDYFVTLTYKRDQRPEDMEGAKKDFKRFLDKVRKEFKKAGVELRWMRNIEIGTKKACHIHLIIKRLDGLDKLIRKNWKHGGVNFQLMYEDGSFRRLADYIAKSPINDKSLSETDFQCSRNMPLPEPKVKEIKGWSITRKIRVPEGWQLDGESVREGVNPVTGYPYRSYMLVRERRKHDSKDQN